MEERFTVVKHTDLL